MARTAGAIARLTRPESGAEPDRASDEPEVAATAGAEFGATDADPTGDGADGAEPGEDGAQPAGPPVALRRLALAAALLFLVTAVVAGWFWNGSRAAEADRAAALDAARQAAVNLTSINFETAEDDVRRVLAGATGDFGGLFGQNIDSYVGLVRDSEVVTAGEVTGIGLEEIDNDTARAVVAVRTNVRNKSVPDGESRFYRMVTEMKKEDGRWLVSRVEFVP